MQAGFLPGTMDSKARLSDRERNLLSKSWLEADGRAVAFLLACFKQ